MTAELYEFHSLIEGGELALPIRPRNQYGFSL